MSEVPLYPSDSSIPRWGVAVGTRDELAGLDPKPSTINHKPKT
jgi:hypothetical protein